MTTHIASDGTVRQDHYGSGRQPWDDIIDAGWAPQFAAGNVLKYLRRVKDPVHSIESARWYYTRLNEFVVAEQGKYVPDINPLAHMPATNALIRLELLCTIEELALLRLGGL